MLYRCDYCHHKGYCIPDECLERYSTLNREEDTNENVQGSIWLRHKSSDAEVKHVSEEQ